MAQLKRVSDPFGEVHVFPSGNGQVRVVATITKPERAGIRAGIGI
jgi:hypothetical protein